MSHEKERKEKSHKKTPLKSLKEKRADKAAKKETNSGSIQLFQPDPRSFFKK